jgi:cytochrome c-type biogenesis protein CcmH/NrfG
MLGQIYHHQNKSDLAADAYRQVLRIQADHSGAQQRLNQLIK